MNYDGTKIYKNIIAGGVAGGFSLTSIYPSEYLKVQKQFSNQTKNYPQLIKYTYQNNGILGFYKGMMPLMVGMIPRAMIQFSGFEYFSYHYKKHITNKEVCSLMSGMSSGVISAILVTCPIDNLKVWSIHNIKDKHSFFNNNRIFINQVGFKGHYNGLSNMILKESLSAGFRFMFYDVFMRNYLKYNNRSIETKTAFDGALIGGVAATCSSFINNPIDVVQTRLQSNYDKKYNGFFDCYRKIRKEEGYKGFYKGCGLRLLRTMPGMMVYFGIYEYLTH